MRLVAGGGLLDEVGDFEPGGFAGWGIGERNGEEATVVAEAKAGDCSFEGSHVALLDGDELVVGGLSVCEVCVDDPVCSTSCRAHRCGSSRLRCSTISPVARAILATRDRSKLSGAAGRDSVIATQIASSITLADCTVHSMSAGHPRSTDATMLSLSRTSMSEGELSVTVTNRSSDTPTIGPTEPSALVAGGTVVVVTVAAGWEVCDVVDRDVVTVGSGAALADVGVVSGVEAIGDTESFAPSDLTANVTAKAIVPPTTSTTAAAASKRCRVVPLPRCAVGCRPHGTKLCVGVEIGEACDQTVCGIAQPGLDLVVVVFAHVASSESRCRSRVRASCSVVFTVPSPLPISSATSLIERFPM